MSFQSSCHWKEPAGLVILVFQEDLEEGEIAVLSSSHDGSGGYGPTSLLEEVPYLLKMVLPR